MWRFNYKSILELESEMVKVRVASVAQVALKVLNQEWMGITVSEIKRVGAREEMKKYNKVKEKGSLWEYTLNLAKSFLILLPVASCTCALSSRGFSHLYHGAQDFWK